MGPGIWSFIALLVGVGFKLSGWENIYAAYLCWLISLVLALYATRGWWIGLFAPHHVIQQINLELKIIGMVVTSIYTHSTRLQLTVHVVNHGQPTTAHRWQLLVRTSAGDWKAKYMPGQEPVKGSLNVPPLDEALRHPLGTNNEVDGFLYFLLPQISHPTAVEQLKDDHKATLSLTVLDSINHEWIAERNTLEMSKERLERRPTT